METPSDQLARSQVLQIIEKALESARSFSARVDSSNLKYFPI